MAIIYWKLAEASEAPVGSADSLLTAGEKLQFEGMKFPKRRREWLLGRYTAKQLLQAVLKPPSITVIEIHNAPTGAPQVWLDGIQQSEPCLSISHSGSKAFCALTTEPAIHVGADLEKIEPRAESFVLDYFTSGELAWVQSLEGETRAFGATLLWSAKEAMLKALGVGLHMDTRQVEIISVEGVGSGSEWNRLQVSARGLAWQAWWCRSGEYILTLAACTDGIDLKQPFVLKQVN